MRRAAFPLAIVCAVGCGDPMLPSDFSGAPTVEVTGTVVQPPSGPRPAAERPRLSMEWLDPSGASLVGQPISFQPSTKLARDWDIGLALPADAVKIESQVGQRAVRIAVGKIVYFDDRDRSEHIEWGCRGTACDRVMAVSAQYVLFVDKPPYCINIEGTGLKTRLSSGYHYYTLSNNTFREVAASDPMSFTITDLAPPDGDPTAMLQVFANTLFRFWSVSFNSGC
jgi:hypothetical protein